MRYSFTSYSLPDADLAGLLRAARQYGYDGIEPRIDEGHAHGIEPSASPQQVREARQQIADSGTALACISTSAEFSAPETAAAGKDQVRRALELAHELGAPRIRVFGGETPAGGSAEESMDTAAEALRSVAGEASDAGVQVCVETHDDWSSPARMAELMHRVDHHAVRVLWDVMHPVRSAGSSMTGAFEVLNPWIAHVHIHDGTTRLDELQFRRMGTGELDHHEVVRLLSGAHYDGFLSGEWIGWEPGAEHLPRELTVLRQYEAALR